MNLKNWAACVLALMACTQHAFAGRPLASDDAGTAGAGTCQLESWVEHAGSNRSLIAAPACGIAQGMELGLEYALPHPRDVLRATGGLALKWVPESWRAETRAGALNFGLKLSASFKRPAGDAWRGADTGLLALATLEPAEAWMVHVNLGAARDRNSGTTASLLNVAIVWTLHADIVLFAENQANTRRSVFGGTLNNVGARWWLTQDRFGLDLTASREAGAASGTSWTLGFGWYGLEV